MVLHLLIIENKERWCLIVERLLEDPEDVLHFDDKTFISTDCHATYYSCWNHFQNNFFQLMNDTNTDAQSESILLSRAGEFKAADKRVLKINRRYCTLEYTNIVTFIVIFIVIVLSVNGP